MTRPKQHRTFAGILLFALFGSCFLTGSDSEQTKKKKRTAESKTAVAEQLKQFREQLNQQQSQIREQQEQIQNLQQQLQQNNSQLGQQSNQTQQLQDEIKQADQKAASAQESATAANASVTAVKGETTTVSQNLQESQKQLDKLVNPEKYLPQPTVVQAINPVRVLPVDPPKRDGLLPAFRIGAIRVTPYGFIKATAIKDSSSPNGDDFPFVGLFLTSTQVTNAGPNGSPEFHLKARSTRFGSNFEWPDMSKRLTLTGRVEGDFEGNFSEVDNRDVSSIRSNEPQLRLAWARLDYHVSDKTDIFFKGGQDWTLFGSTALPNIVETTFLGAFYGVIYTRSPQMTIGMVQDLGGSRKLKFLPEVGIMMPSSGQILKLGSVGLAGQLGEGEREGADSDRPELEARAVLQFQLDKATGVAPAQLIVSGFEAKRTSIATNASTVVGTTPEPANYAAAFPNGFTSSSQMYGGQVAAQLPTRWFTVTASAYRGGDLRFYFGGQVNSYATNIAGLTNPIAFTTTDGGPLTAAGMAVLATNAAGNVVVAPQKPIRAFGGFLNLGLPLSRWFNADPKGHNAGWQLYFHVGKDQVVSRDLTNPGFAASVNTLSPLPLLMGKMGAATIYYKFNQWCQFAFEQSVYATRLSGGVASYTIGTNSNGTPRMSNEWQDHRTELGPIFTF
jgi:hypothetical protein